MIKPNAVKDKNTGKIIDRIEQEGFTIVAMKKTMLSKIRAEKFYGVHKGKPFFKNLVKFITSGPIIAMVLEKENAIKTWRDLMGATNPAKAAPNTLRKLYAASYTQNAVHGSDAPETAATEINFFFPELPLNYHS